MASGSVEVGQPMLGTYNDLGHFKKKKKIHAAFLGNSVFFSMIFFCFHNSQLNKKTIHLKKKFIDCKFTS